MNLKKLSWKKAIFALGVAAIAVGAAVNVSINSNGGYLSDLQLANIEALARSEDGGGVGRCGWTGATVAPCLTNWSGECTHSCATFLAGTCPQSASVYWCVE